MKQLLQKRKFSLSGTNFYLHIFFIRGRFQIREKNYKRGRLKFFSYLCLYLTKPRTALWATTGHKTANYQADISEDISRLGGTISG